MDLRYKERNFKSLQDRIEKNMKAIQLFKNTSPVLMSLFVIISFLMFYNNISNTDRLLQLLYIVVLAILFISLALFYYLIERKQKENIILDTKIYNLLKL